MYTYILPLFSLLLITLRGTEGPKTLDQPRAGSSSLSASTGTKNVLKRIGHQAPASGHRQKANRE